MPGDMKDTTPTPDPTVLTTEALQRAIATLDQEQRERQGALVRETEARAETRGAEFIALRATVKNGRKSDLLLFEAKLDVLRERYAGQDRILALMEDQRRERKEDERRALDAALAAAENARVADTEASERANTKTELSTAEQLRQQTATSQAAIAGLTALFNAVQTRVERIENLKQGSTDERQDNRGNSQQMWLVLAGLVGVAGLFMMMLSVGVAIFFATR